MLVPDVKTARKEEKQSGNNTCYIAQTLEDCKGTSYAENGTNKNSARNDKTACAVLKMEKRRAKRPQIKTEYTHLLMRVKPHLKRRILAMLPRSSCLL